MTTETNGWHGSHTSCAGPQHSLFHTGLIRQLHPLPPSCLIDGHSDAQRTQRRSLACAAKMFTATAVAAAGGVGGHRMRKAQA